MSERVCLNVAGRDSQVKILIEVNRLNYAVNGRYKKPLNTYVIMAPKNSTELSDSTRIKNRSIEVNLEMLFLFITL